MDRITLLTVLIPALPLAATIITAVFGARALKNLSHLPIALALIVAFLCSLSLVFRISEEQQRPEYSGQTGFAQTVTLFERNKSGKCWHPDTLDIPSAVSR